jgi:parvulin-like peptidyl-prolyl isomerase
MTIRVRPVDRGRSSRDPNRRTVYTNIAFAVVIGLAVLILVGVGVATWYDAHLAAAAKVDGQTITKDQFVDRARVEQFRLQQLAARVNAEVNAGRLTAAQGEARINTLNQQLDDSQGAFTSRVIEKLIDTRLQAKLAGDLGVTVTPDQIDARILEEKTRPEERHVFLIAVKPEVDTGKTDPTDAQKAAAKAKADTALKDINGGKAFADVAKAVSTDPTASSGGDLGWLDTTASEDKAWQDAVFKLEANGVTAVIEGEDGTYRIGRVSEIVPPQIDAAYDQKLADAKISQDVYRGAIQSEVLRTALGDRIVADAKASKTEKSVQELYIRAPSTTPGEGAIKVRHILFSPKDSPDTAQTLPDTDPEWTKAQLAAQDAYNKIKADPSLFDSIARDQSDETSATGDSGTGGKLPYFDKDSGIDQAFADAILKPELQPGQLLEPFKSGFGWHVVQVMYRPPDSDEIAKLRDQAIAGDAAAWKAIVRDFSDGQKPTTSGDIGWVRLGTLDDRLTSVILATPKGQFTPVIDAKDDGLYVFKVVDERSQDPDKEETAKIESDAFSNWYTGKKAAATITRDLLGG